ncbi:MAG TPA: hypothetical protein VK911_08690, partial [Vicinamibacterales bacterium]|nr:hypothetical protein [Vicinamibacterales bacterium]
MTKVLGGWQVNGIFSAYSGTPYSISGSNPALNCPGCGSVYVNVSGDPKPVGEAGSATEAYYDTSLFSQPTGLGAEGFGNSGRNRFRRPPVWNLDMSLFKGFQIGRVRPEIRIQAANIFNHVNWGAPNTSITSPLFMTFPVSAAENATNSPGARNIQIGLRVGF